ncbi:ComEC/Rec2 family competence protein [Paenibacillus paeoniae]|uniref:MBL fold metallo-hydrolase n=1 Tax=Paenibacillus paeoniae TaxID=2292705 RepID=A0A371PHA8_9BACL|nr:MBL fold metallo-hydrolase [Paenibacillus paeoniae]REK75591.1 MBL fold metallo-hydrolase [Paenibacillus paeoniae]
MGATIDFLNVGFGESTVIRLEHGDESFCLVVDAGDSFVGDGARRCSPSDYVREYAISHIDVLVLTHFHRDHIGGVLSLLGGVSIGEIRLHVELPPALMSVELNRYDTPMLASLSMYAELLHKAKEMCIPICKMTRVNTLELGEVALTFLMPDPAKLMQLEQGLTSLDPARLDEQQDMLGWIDRQLNETAMALLVRSNDEPVALLTSDVGLDFWKPYEAEITGVCLMQAPHHGDRRSISEELLDKLAPRYIVVSADDEGTYQLPHLEFDQLIHRCTDAKLVYTEAIGTTHRIIRMDISNRRLNLID